MAKWYDYAIPAVLGGLNPFGLGPLLAATSGGISGYQEGGGRGIFGGALKGASLGAVGAGIKGGITGGISGATGADAGFGSKLAGAGSGAWQGAGAGLTNYVQSIPGFGEGGKFGPAPVSEYAGISPEPVGTAGTRLASASPSATAMGLPTAGELALTYPTGGITPAGVSTAGTSGLGIGTIGPSAAPASSGIWDTLWGAGKNVLGTLGTNFLSQGLRAGAVAVPQAEPSMEARDKYRDIYSQVSEGGATPTGRIGTEKLGEMVAGEGWTDLDQSRYDMAASNLDEDLEKKLKEMEKMYAAYGALDSGQYREEVSRMMNEASDLKQQMLYEMQAKGMERQMTAVAQAVDYDVNTVNQLFSIAQGIGADEIMRTNMKNQNYEQLRRDLNTLAYAADGGGEVKEDAEGNIFDTLGRELSKAMVEQMLGTTR